MAKTGVDLKIFDINDFPKKTLAYIRVYTVVSIRYICYNFKSEQLFDMQAELKK